MNISSDGASDMTAYTLGFIFGLTGDVALVRKRKGPGDQRNKLNGFGGKIEKGETPLACMIREFREEAGFDHWDWRYIEDLKGKHWVVHVYAAYCPDIREHRFVGKEKVEVYDYHFTFVEPDGDVKATEFVNGVRRLVKKARHTLEMEGFMFLENAEIS